MITGMYTIITVSGSGNSCEKLLPRDHGNDGGYNDWTVTMITIGITMTTVTVVLISRMFTMVNDEYLP